jgi:prepilin-type N-terminal cleavage/methylation domain-containing protein
MRTTLRGGFTLIELLVTMSIIAVLATLTVVYVIPAFQDNKNVVRGLDRIVTMLLIAKQRALRDQRPVGVRFDVETDTDPGNATVTRIKSTKLRYVEQPDIVSGWGAHYVQAVESGAITYHAKLPDIDLRGGGATTGDTNDYLGQPEDWLKIGPQNFRMHSLVNVTSSPVASIVKVYHPPSTPAAYGGRWQLIRQTRPIGGEEMVELPVNVAVDFGTILPSPPAGTAGSLSATYGANVVPNRTVGSGTNTVTLFEVVFRPDGAIMNSSGSSIIVVWVRDESQTWTTIDFNTSRVIAISPRTGQVSTHEMNPDAARPLAFALDGKASGL